MNFKKIRKQTFKKYDMGEVSVTQEDRVGNNLGDRDDEKKQVVIHTNEGELHEVSLI